MANSFVRYTGDGNTSAYSIPFSYRSTADLVVTIAGVASTAYTLPCSYMWARSANL